MSATFPLTGSTTLVAVKKTRTKSGTTIIAIVRNWRRRKATAPSWMAASDLAHGRRALVGGEHAAHQVQRHDYRYEACGDGEHQPAALGASEREGLVAAFAREEVRDHRLLLCSGRGQDSR